MHFLESPQKELENDELLHKLSTLDELKCSCNTHEANNLPNIQCSTPENYDIYLEWDDENMSIKPHTKQIKKTKTKRDELGLTCQSIFDDEAEYIPECLLDDSNNESDKIVYEHFLSNSDDKPILSSFIKDQNIDNSGTDNKHICLGPESEQWYASRWNSGIFTETSEGEKARSTEDQKIEEYFRKFDDVLLSKPSKDSKPSPKILTEQTSNTISEMRDRSEKDCLMSDTPAMMKQSS